MIVIRRSFSPLAARIGGRLVGSRSSENRCVELVEGRLLSLTVCVDSPGRYGARNEPLSLSSELGR